MKFTGMNVSKGIIVFLSLLLISNTATAEENGPVIWEISDEDTTIHLFGSVHLLKPGVDWLSDDLKKTISDSDAIYLELSADQHAPHLVGEMMAKYGFLPNGGSLQSIIPEDIFDALMLKLENELTPRKILMRIKPWLAAQMYSIQIYAEAGYKPEFGVEKVVERIAEANGIDVKGLETLDFQFSLFNSFSNDVEIRGLRELVFNNEKQITIMNEITSAWMSGDLETIEKMTKESLVDYPGVDEKLLYARNRNWVKKINQILEMPGIYFVAVGTAHLVGENSLIDLLEKDFE